MLLWVILSAVVVAVIYYLSGNSKERLNSLAGRTVFISGCDSGFGHATALRLDKLGMTVFAGCLTEQGAQDLRSKGSSQLQTIIFNITKQEDIDKAAQIVSSSCPDGLWALVNNAGIAVGGEWDWFSMDMLRRILEINLIGHIATTKALLPLLKKRKGRIVNISSCAGIVAGPLLGAYSCTKFGMEAFSDSLRREMYKWGVSVHVLEPFFTNTPILTNGVGALANMWNALSPEVKAEYGEAYANDILNPRPIPPSSVDPIELVLDAIQDAVINKYPKSRQRVGKMTTVVYILSLLPTNLGDWALDRLNAYSRPLPAALLKKS